MIPCMDDARRVLSSFNAEIRHSFHRWFKIKKQLTVIFERSEDTRTPRRGQQRQRLRDAHVITRAIMRAFIPSDALFSSSYAPICRRDNYARHARGRGISSVPPRRAEKSPRRWKKEETNRAPSRSRCTLLALLKKTSGTRSFVVDDNQPGIVLDAGIALCQLRSSRGIYAPSDI